MAPHNSTGSPPSGQTEHKGGIYAIRCAANKRVYVGSSIDVRRRLRDHRTDLEMGRHENPRLQRAWKKYGPPSFTFETIALAPDDELIALEQFFIDSLGACDRRRGFNICPVAGSTLGHKHDAATLAKLSEISLERWADPAFREKMTAIRRATFADPEVIEKIRATRRAMFREDPEYREKVLAGVRLMQSEEAVAKRKLHYASRASDEKFKAAVSASSKARWADPEYRAKMSRIAADRAKRLAADPEYRAKMSAAIKAKYENDPEWVARRNAAVAASKAKGAPVA